VSASGSYVETGDVNTWYDEFGAGPPLVLLHPGLVDSRALADMVPWFADQHRVFTPERRGHGRTADAVGPLTFEQMGRDTVAFVEAVVGEPVRLCGVSDGAMVAIQVAATRPDLVERVACVSGPFHLRGWLPEAIDPANEPPEFFVEGYGELSPDGIEHFPVVVEKLAQAHLEGPTLTPSDLARVTARALVMLGDDDEVTLEHALEFYRALPTGELAVVPGTSHALVVEKPELCRRILVDFFTLDAPETYVPIRRRAEIETA
jgi:pimeloyl-ACP methyl ester carboxylesterase